MTQSPEQNKKNLFSVEKEQEICPECAGHLVIKSGQHGPFLGCENYPQCHFIRALKPHHESSVIRAIPERHCPECGAELAIKQGRYGMFIGCSDYPKCDYIVRDETDDKHLQNTVSNTADLTEVLEPCAQDAHSVEILHYNEQVNSADQANSITCPACKNGHLVKRMSRFGKAFWGCDNFPNCKFIVNDTPIKIACPACGFTVMTYRAERNQAQIKSLKCANKRCAKKVPYADILKTDSLDIDNLSLASIDRLITALNMGQVISYPTEAVFGLGCDPDNQTAVESLCALKSRPLSKGLILVAEHFEQLHPYLDLTKLNEAHFQALHASWPGPFTWVIPAHPNTPKWLTGDFDSIAVRVSAHPTIQALTKAYGKPIVSTSANLTGHEPAKTAEEVFEQFGKQVIISSGHIGQQSAPTVIRDILTGKVLRA